MARLVSMLCLAALSVGAIATPGARAQIAPIGPEFQVNTFTPGEQVEADVAGDAEGDFVVVWRSDDAGAVDPSDRGIRCRLFGADAEPLADDFEIGSYTTDAQERPRVARRAAGDFVVVWQSIGSPGDDADGWSVQASRFDSSGNPTGDQFQVNGDTTGHQFDPDVAIDASGGFVVAWISDPSGSDTELRARRFGPDGGALGAEFAVNSWTTGPQWWPRIAMEPGGDFVVAWSSGGSWGDDSDGLSVQARRFGFDGTPVAPEFQVNTWTTGQQYTRDVACDELGNFVIGWDGFAAASDESVEARVYDASGAPRTGQFQLNGETAGGRWLTGLAMAPDGGFVAAWEAASSSGTDQDSYSLHVRRFDDATPLGNELQINTTTTGYQWRARVGADGRGGFVVVWESLASAGTDSWGYSVQAQRYLDPSIFLDGFELGEWSRWSATVP